jgi:hypothetical protein
MKVADETKRRTPIIGALRDGILKIGRAVQLCKLLHRGEKLEQLIRASILVLIGLNEPRRIKCLDFSVQHYRMVPPGRPLRCSMVRPDVS